VIEILYFYFRLLSIKVIGLIELPSVELRHHNITVEVAFDTERVTREEA
jgi:hypothetical protein